MLQDAEQCEIVRFDIKMGKDGREWFLKKLLSLVRGMTSA